MPKRSDNLLIFTDLDGSLLDHDTYDWRPAQSCLQYLKQHDIPIIITTSKTVSETTRIRRELGLEHYPFIVENGASVELPENWHGHIDYPRRLFSADYAEICGLLKRLQVENRFNFRCFSAMSDSDVATLTNLPMSQARQARQRQASEPVLWLDDRVALRHFIEQLDYHGLSLLQGGRFHHVIGKGVSKGAAAIWLQHQYQHIISAPFITLGLGDGPNDVSLLQTTDYAVVIRGQNQQHITLGATVTGKTYFAHNTGPAGWCEGLSYFISGNYKREVALLNKSDFG